MPALDALKAFWILGVFLFMFFWLPAHLFSGRPNCPRDMRIAGDWARTVLCVTILVFLLSSLRVLGAIAVVLLVVGAIGVGWLRKRAGMPGRLLMSLQATTINMIRMVESRSFGLYLLARRRAPASARPFCGLRINSWLRVLEGRELLVACFAVALGTTVVLRAEHAVRELRFDQPEQYSALLRARELMLNIHPADRPFVFPAVIAATSLLSSTDPTQVTRFLTPVFGLLVVLATGLLIHVCTGAGVACVAAVYCLGAAVLPSARDPTGVAMSAMEKLQSVFSGSPATIRATPEFAFGLLFLLLALTFLADWYSNSRGWDSLLDFACCLLLVGIVSQVLLVVLMMAAGVVLLRPMAGLLTFVILCYALVAYATLSTGITVPAEMSTILPVAAAILVGCVLAMIEASLVARIGRRAETVLLAACLCVAVIWLRPQRLVGRYLEYEAAARATQEITYRFPRETWVVAAPLEQLSETAGLGGYLTDSTYRNYRSPGGRASLEAAALQLCESYRQYHLNADVFFENEDLRIYHIHQPASDTKPKQ